MVDDKPSLTSQVKERLATHEDLSKLTEPGTKKEFLDNLEADLKAPRTSLEAIFSKAIKPAAVQKGLDPDIFAKKRAPRYAPKLAVQSTVTPKPAQAAPTRPGLKAQNPAVQAVPDMPDLPLKHVAGALDSFVSAVVENMEELTPSEKDDVGACLQMAIGDWINTHEKARMVFGVVGILGVYGGRIKKARRITKAEKEKKEKETKQTTQALKALEPKFEAESQKYIEQKEVSDI